MSGIEIPLKLPVQRETFSSPFFQRGSFAPGRYPLPSINSGQALGKEGKGRFLGGVRGELCRKPLGQDTSPDYAAMLEKRVHTVSSLRGEPFPAALNGPLPCRPPPDPLQRCLFLPSGPERNVNVSLSAASMAHPSARRKEKPGRYESRRTETLRCQRAGTWQGSHCDLALEYSGYAYLPGSNGARDLRRLGVIGERGRDLLRRLKGRSGFLS